MNRVAIVDYGMGNLDSVARAIEECGGSPIVTDKADDIGAANRIILPGVGAFPDGMRNLRARGLDQILGEQVALKGIPLLGICLGMQLLATTGTEVEETLGLGWIRGKVIRLVPRDGDTRIPHVGWNEVNWLRDNPLGKGISSGQDYYFVHSYHFSVDDDADILAKTPYAGGFVSAVGKEGIFGVQFHPEKSQKRGFRLLRNFLAC